MMDDVRRRKVGTWASIAWIVAAAVLVVVALLAYGSPMKWIMMSLGALQIAAAAVLLFYWTRRWK